MLHPTVAAALTAEHQADLIRAAGAQRRVARLVRHDRHIHGPLGSGNVKAVLTGLRARLAHEGRPTPPSAAEIAAPAAELCCA